MADQTAHELAPIAAPARDVAMIGQPTDADTRTTQVPMPLVGAMELGGHASDANETLLAGVHALLDLSLQTAERDYTTPATCRVGERVGVQVTVAGQGAAIKTQAGQLIHQTSFSAAPYITLLNVGDMIVLRCVKADSEFVVDQAYVGHPDDAVTVQGGVVMEESAGVGAKWVAKPSAETPWTPDVLVDGNCVALTGTTTITVNNMVTDGAMEIRVPANCTVTLNGYKTLGAQDIAETNLLVLRRIDDGAAAEHLAVWGAFS